MNSYTYTYGNRTLQTEYESSFVNGRVVFFDSSWIDLRTGEMSQKVGVASLAKVYPPFPEQEKRKNDDPAAQAASEEARKPKRFAKSFDAKAVTVQAVPNAAVKVIPHTDGTSAIVVEMSGPAEAIDAITVDQHGTTVMIKGPHFGGGNFNVQSIIGGSFTNIRIGNVVISGSSVNVHQAAQEPEVQLTVKVPKGASVNLLQDWFSAEIGDTEGPVHIVSLSTADVTVGKVTNINLDLNSRGSITVKESNGVAKLDNSGTGSIRVEKGSAPLFSLDVSSRGSIHYLGTAENVTIDNSGTGTAYLTKALKQLSIDLDSVGPVTVEDLEVENLKIDSSGTGDINLPKGSVAQALSIDVSSRGSVTYGGTAKKIDIDDSGIGSVNLTNTQNVATSLKIEVSSRGDVTYRGTAEVVSIDDSGIGNVTVGEVTSILDIDVSSRGSVAIEKATLKRFDADNSGIGDIHITTGTADRASIDLSSRGNVTFNGTVGDADLDNSGIGNITVRRTTGRVKKDRSSRGQIIIESAA